MTLFTRLGRAAAAIGRQAGRVRTDRAVRAGALVAAVVLALVEAAIGGAVHGLAVPLAFALALVHAGGLPLATRLPNVAAPVSLAAALALQALSASSAGIWPWWPVLIVTQSLLLAVVATRTVLAVALLHWASALIASVALAALLRPDPQDEVTVDLVVFGAVSAAVIVIALTTTQWRRVRSELLQERRLAAAEAEQRLLVEERQRIARELHDVVAHGLSIITVQSATARFRHQGFSAEAAEEFERIGDLSRQALDEMRGLLRVLRGSDDDAERRPQPGLPDLPDLVAQAASSGTPVLLHVPDGDWAGGVGPVTGLAAYRIVQEATSNALRHAPGAAVRIGIERTAKGLEILVANDPAERAAGAGARPGHGLVGMAERAASAGGTIRSGPADGGGWTVRAFLPVLVPRAA